MIVAAHSSLKTVKWSSVRHLDLNLSYLEIHGERLDKQHAGDVLKQMCPQANIDLHGYEVGERRHWYTHYFSSLTTLSFTTCCIV